MGTTEEGTMAEEGMTAEVATKALTLATIRSKQATTTSAHPG